MAPTQSATQTLRNPGYPQPAQLSTGGLGTTLERRPEPLRWIPGAGGRDTTANQRRDPPNLGQAVLMGLEDDPFDWRVTKDGQVLVSRGGRVVTTIRGASAAKLLGRLERAGDDEAQQLLARATGHYKHGNERHG